MLLNMKNLSTTRPHSNYNVTILRNEITSGTDTKKTTYQNDKQTTLSRYF